MYKWEGDSRTAGNQILMRIAESLKMRLSVIISERDCAHKESIGYHR